MKKELEIIGQKILNAEREIVLGKDVKSNEDKIQKYMENLSPTDLLEVVMYVDEKISIDNQEKF